MGLIYDASTFPLFHGKQHFALWVHICRCHQEALQMLDCSRRVLLRQVEDRHLV